MKPVLFSATLLLAIGLTHMSSAQERPDELTEVYGNWTYLCTTVQSGEERIRSCEILQEQRQQGTNQRVIAFGIRLDEKDGEAGAATVIAPFGIRLVDGLRIAQDGETLLTSPISTCMPVGCIVTMTLPASLVERFREGQSFQILLSGNDNGAEFSIEMPLNGFKTAWDRLTGG
jgi:invasion protein IalB